MRTLDLAALTAGLVTWFDQTRDDVRDRPMEHSAASILDALAPQVAELARAAKPYGGRA